MFGIRLGGYSNRKPIRQGVVRYGQGMLKSPLDKSELTSKQIRNEKVFNSLSIRIKEWLGLPV